MSDLNIGLSGAIIRPGDTLILCTDVLKSREQVDQLTEDALRLKDRLGVEVVLVEGVRQVAVFRPDGTGV